MDSASSLEVVRWLHENQSEVCTMDTMDNAVFYGHFVVLLFLRAHRSEGCTVQAADFAANHRDLEILQWLYAHYPKKVDVHCTRSRFGYDAYITALLTHKGL
uniref:Calponin-homology (CH) domain-containing protein n=1 Tax=Globisporangium ultimum (strain ATCC 200006 / CBS 805.95 / DAOM BR144) TaxID=431595 RepID=K3WWS2_GLOUD